MTAGFGEQAPYEREADLVRANEALVEEVAGLKRLATEREALLVKAIAANLDAEGKNRDLRDALARLVDWLDDDHENGCYCACYDVDDDILCGVCVARELLK